MEAKWIKRLYIIFVGIILAITTGFGVAAFYPEPQSPVYPNVRAMPRSCYDTPDSSKSAECIKLNDEEDQKQRDYQESLQQHRDKNAGYTRTAVFLGVAVGAIFAVLGIVVLRSSSLVANGLMLAGVLTAVLTRFLVMLASLGAPTTATTQAGDLAYIEFAVLVILSLGVLLVGLFYLKD